jgi:hypothetical protein
LLWSFAHLLSFRLSKVHHDHFRCSIQTPKSCRQ